LLAAWPLITRFPTGPEYLERWRAVAEAYPNRAEVWYWLGDAYFHNGRALGLDDRLRLAQQAFRRGWALDSANTCGPDSVRPPCCQMTRTMARKAGRVATEATVMAAFYLSEAPQVVTVLVVDV
jgi:hypothetical protein